MDAVSIDNGAFTWDKTSGICLDDVNMKVKKGKLVGIVGSVGSGKSSLLSALLGEMCKLKGRVNVKVTHQ